MLWLAVDFPDLGLEIHTRALPRGASPRALALVQEGRVLACNAEAQAAGVAPGQRTASALALCPSLRFLDYLPEEEARLLRQLAEACIAVTPTVVLAPPHSLLLEVGGCLQLFRGQAGLLKALQRALKPFGVRAVLAQAPTPKAALALVNSEQAQASLQLPVLQNPTLRSPDAAQRNPGAAPLDHAEPRIPAQAPPSGLQARSYLPLLREVPVTTLPWEGALQKKLAALHLHTLGELLALPRAALSKRLGVAATRYLAQLTGELPDPQLAITVAEDFEATLFFLDGISHVEGLRFPMKRLLDDFCRFLRQRQLSCARFSWRFAHQDKSRQQLPIASARGEPQAARFMQLTELKLEHFRISAPVEAITLQAREFQPQSDTRLALLPEPGQEDEKAMELLDRLRARLGVEACQLVAQVDARRPEAEQQLHSDGKGGSDFALGYASRSPTSVGNSRGAAAHKSAARVGLKPDPQTQADPQIQAGPQTQVGPQKRAGRPAFAADAQAGGMEIDGQPSPLFAAPFSTQQPLRPFWLWPEPKVVRWIDGTLWWQGAFTLLSRPERIALPWWEDGETRDYYLARHENGGHYWLYFSREKQEWFCQGVFG